jgi:hypothetical protein
MMSEDQGATVDALRAESTRVVIVHDDSMQRMPEWLRTSVREELRQTYSPLAFESKDVMFGTTRIYVRINPMTSLSTSSTVAGSEHQSTRSPALATTPPDHGGGGVSLQGARSPGMR